MIQDVLAVVCIIQIIASIPLLTWVFKIRDTITKVANLDLDLEKFKKEIRDKINIIEEQHQELADKMQEATMKQLEVMGAINIAITKLNGSVDTLNKNIEKGESQLGEVIRRVYKELDDHKDQTTKLITKLIESNGKD